MFKWWQHAEVEVEVEVEVSGGGGVCVVGGVSVGWVGSCVDAQLGVGVASLVHRTHTHHPSPLTSTSWVAGTCTSAEHPLAQRQYPP